LRIETGPSFTPQKIWHAQRSVLTGKRGMRLAHQRTKDAHTKARREKIETAEPRSRLRFRAAILTWISLDAQPQPAREGIREPGLNMCPQIFHSHSQSPSPRPASCRLRERRAEMNLTPRPSCSLSSDQARPVVAPRACQNAAGIESLARGRVADARFDIQMPLQSSLWSQGP